MQENAKTISTSEASASMGSKKEGRFLRKCRIYQFWRFIVLNLLVLKVAKNPPHKTGH